MHIYYISLTYSQNYKCLKLNVVHPVVFYNNILSTKGSVKHNTNIVLKYTLGVATCFGLSRGHFQAMPMRHGIP
jgi:hypothetical protein